MELKYIQMIIRGRKKYPQYRLVQIFDKMDYKQKRALLKEILSLEEILNERISARESVA